MLRKDCAVRQRKAEQTATPERLPASNSYSTLRFSIVLDRAPFNATIFLVVAAKVANSLRPVDSRFAIRAVTQQYSAYAGECACSGFFRGSAEGFAGLTAEYRQPAAAQERGSTPDVSCENMGWLSYPAKNAPLASVIVSGPICSSIGTSGGAIVRKYNCWLG